MKLRESSSKFVELLKSPNKTDTDLLNEDIQELHDDANVLRKVISDIDLRYEKETERLDEIIVNLTNSLNKHYDRLLAQMKMRDYCFKNGVPFKDDCE